MGLSKACNDPGITKPRTLGETRAGAPDITASADANPLSITTVAGSGLNQTTDGTGTGASFKKMGGVVLVGNYAYVGTWGSIRKVDLATKEVTTLAGHATATGCANSTDHDQVRFNQINGLTTDGYYLYTTGTCGSTSAVRRTSIETGATSTVASGSIGADVTLGPDGMLYATGAKSVYRIDPALGTMTLFGSLTGNTHSITADEANLWVAWVPGTTLAIERFAMDGSHTTWVSGPGLGAAALASFGGYLYATNGDYQFRRYVKSDKSFAVVGGTGSNGYQDGVGTDAWFSNIYGMASDAARLLIVDGNYRLRQGVDASPLPSSQQPWATSTLGLSVGAVGTWAGNGTNATVDGIGTAASFKQMGGVVVVDDYAYVGTSGSIRKVDLATKEVTTLAGNATATGCVNSTDHDQVRFNQIHGITTDGYYLYTAGGCPPTSALRRTSLETGATSTVTTGQVGQYVTFGPDGMLYANGGNNSVYRVDPSTGTKTLFGMLSGSPYSITADGSYLWVAWVPGVGGAIERFAMDGSHETLVSDASIGTAALASAGNFLYGVAGSNILRLYDKATGFWLDIAGSGEGGYADGSGTSVRFFQIVGIASDGTHLWISDRQNYRLRKVIQGYPTQATIGACGLGDFVFAACNLEAEPVNTGSGDYFLTATDASLPGIGVPFEFVRSYNSLDATSGPLGPGWTHAYNMTLSSQSGVVTIRQGDGKQFTFTRQNNGSYYGGPGVRSTLQAVEGGYVLTSHSQIAYRFNTQGRLVSVKDRNGQGLTLSYDVQGKLSTILDGAGRTVTFAYTDGLLSSMALAGGRSVSYAYTDGRLTSVVDIAGGTTTYTFDAQGRLDSVTDPNNDTVVQNVYGPDGRVIQQTDGRGNVSTFDWDPATRTSTYTDARGHEWQDVYDSGAFVERIDPLGNVTRYMYTGADLTRITDARGNTTRMTYDSRGNLLTKTDPLGNSTVYTYTERNDVRTVTDPRGNTTTYDYDASGNLVQITKPGDVITVLSRDPVTGLLTGSTDPNGHTTTFGYDAQGNLTSVTDPLGHQTIMTYDASGRMVSRVDPRGNEPEANPDDYRWTFAYDAADRLVSQADPLGNTTTFTYDGVGDLLARMDANDHTTSYTYDGDRNLTTVTAPDATVTSYSYDETNNLVSRTDANGHTTTYAYDDADRRVSTTSPMGQTWSFAYDANGNLTTKTLPSGHVTYAYDANGQLTGISYSDAPTTPNLAFGYDENGNRTSMTDGAGNVSYTYDALNRLTQVTRGADTFVYAYDPASNLTSRTYPDETIIAYGYDDADRLTGVTTGGLTTEYGYDPASNIATITRPNGVDQTRSYDRAGRLTSISDGDGVTTISSFVYTLDSVGNPTQAATSSETIAYDYDDLYRLILACYTPDCAGQELSGIGYTYDPVGNRLTEIRYGVSGSTTTAYEYNADDELTRTLGPGGGTDYSYDPNGNQTQAGSRTFAYDLQNRLISTTSSGTTEAYSYDGDGNRLSMATDGMVSREYLWDQNAPLPKLAIERDGAGPPLRWYVYGQELTPLSMSTGDSEHYYLSDLLGSVANLTSAEGSREWSYRYEPFGAARVTMQEDPAAPANLVRFTGQLHDSTTGLYDLRARMYDPVTGRFLQTDPVTLPSGAQFSSTYAYALDSPVRFSDPSGECIINSDPCPFHDLLEWFKREFNCALHPTSCGGPGVGTPGTTVTEALIRGADAYSTNLLLDPRFQGCLSTMATAPLLGQGAPGLAAFIRWGFRAPGFFSCLSLFKDSYK
ncbi:MAG: DUF6531 domain-containing protein [Actinomycetota bacterium]